MLASAIKEDPGGSKIPLRGGRGDEPARPAEPARALGNYLLPSPRPRHPVLAVPHRITDMLSCDSKWESRVAQLLVRDVPEDVVEALKRRAAEHGRSAEAEHRAILEEALCRGRSGFWERAAKLREETRGRITIPSEVLIRQDRDEH